MIYYIPISTASLAHHAGSACIKPAKYFNNKPEDIQDSWPCGLLLTSKENSDIAGCCIEVELLPEESRHVIEAGPGWFAYDMAIPFSRVRSITFASAEQMEITLANIELSTAYIPNRLCRVSSVTNLNRSCPTIPADIEPRDLSRQIEIFDRLLGAFTIMRTVGARGWLPDNYFGMLGMMCPEVEAESRAAPALRLLSGTITEETVEKVAASEGQTIKADPLTKLIDLTHLERQTYVFAVLATYGVGNESRRKKIDELILSGFKKGIRHDMSELVATYYGYNRGYSAFPKRYTGTTPASLKDTKMRFDSLVDYYTVECVYRHAYFNQPTHRSRELEAWWPHKRVPAGDRMILDYSVTRQETKSARICSVKIQPRQPETWLTETVMRHVSRLDPTKSTFLSFGLDIANDIYKQISARYTAVESPRLRRALADRWCELSAMDIDGLLGLASSLGMPKQEDAIDKDALVKLIFLYESRKGQ